MAAVALALALALPLADPIWAAGCGDTDGWNRDGWTRIATIAPPYDPSGNLPDLFWWRASIAEIGVDVPILYAAPTLVGLARSDFCGRHWNGPHFQDRSVAFPSFDPTTNWYRDPSRLVVAEAQGRLHVRAGSQPLDSTSDDGGRSWRPTGRVLRQGDSTPSAATLESAGFSRTIPGLGYARVGARGGREPGVLARTEDGTLWRELRAPFPIDPGSRVLVDPDPSLAYGFVGTALHRLTYSEGAAEVDLVATFDSEITATAMSVDGGRFYVATAYHGLFRSPDRGVTWNPVPGPTEDGYWTGFDDVRGEPEATAVGFWRGLEVSRFDPPVLYGISASGEFWIYREPGSTP